MQTGVRAVIEDFLSHRRIAMVGVSRKANDFSRVLFQELRSRGYDVIPVNPNTAEIDGQRCYPAVQEIHPSPEAVLVMTPGTQAEDVVKGCAAAGVARVWMYRAVGQGAVSPAALSFCEENGISVVPGECPFMFLAGGSWIHAAHRFCRKVMGTFPT